jgi:hypothetical protein
MRAGMRDARKTVAMPPRTQVSVGSGQGAITCAGYADKPHLRLRRRMLRCLVAPHVPAIAATAGEQFEVGPG